MHGVIKLAPLCSQPASSASHNLWQLLPVWTQVVVGYRHEMACGPRRFLGTERTPHLDVTCLVVPAASSQPILGVGICWANYGGMHLFVGQIGEYLPRIGRCTPIIASVRHCKQT